jgi:hypothetical protein
MSFAGFLKLDKIETIMLKKSLIFGSDDRLIKSRCNVGPVQIPMYKAGRRTGKQMLHALPDHHHRKRRINELKEGNLKDREDKAKDQ